MHALLATRAAMSQDVPPHPVSPLPSRTRSIFWVFGIDFWILPHLWSDDVSIIDAFKPLYTWDRKPGNVSGATPTAAALVVAAATRAA